MSNSLVRQTIPGHPARSLYSSSEKSRAAIERFRRHRSRRHRHKSPAPECARIIHQFAEYFAKGIDWILHRTAKGATVEISLGAVDEKLEVVNSLESVSHGGDVGSKHRGIADQDEIAREFSFEGRERLIDRDAAYLFFPFNDEFDVDRQFARGFHPSFNSLDVGIHLPFVIRRTARIRCRCESLAQRTGLPEFERFGRLDIVMPVDEECRLAGDEHSA